MSAQRKITNHAYVPDRDGRCGLQYGTGADRERCGHTADEHATVEDPAGRVVYDGGRRHGDHQLTMQRWTVRLYLNGELVLDETPIDRWQAADIAAPTVAELAGGTVSVANAVVTTEPGPS